MAKVDSTASKKPTALVTGATGFIGTHLVNKLQDEGYVVRVYSRQAYGEDPRLQVSSKDWITAELSDTESLLSACDGVDIIFHAAGIAHSKANVDDLITVNVTGLQSVYSAAVAANVRKFVFFSSILASQPEHSAYAESKWSAEELLITSNESNSGTQVVILRPANVYGAGMKGNILTFIRMANSRFIPALPLLKNTFPLISVTDLCDVAIGATQDKTPMRSVEIYVVTDGEQYTPNRIESAVYGCSNRLRPKLKMPLLLFYVAAGIAQIVDLLGVKKNHLGLNLYRNLIGTRQVADCSGVPSYDFVPTATLETEMSNIIHSLARD